MEFPQGGHFCIIVHTEELIGLGFFLLIVMDKSVMAIIGYRKRTGFLAGLMVAQISEFAIIFVAMGITLGHVGPSALGLTTLVHPSTAK